MDNKDLPESVRLLIQLSILGILLDNDGKLLKLVQKPPKGEREVNFYRSVFAKDVSDSVTLKLRSFLPAFHGTRVVSNSGLSFQHILIFTYFYI